ncbi:InlB B-repeat-containing protein [Leucobacter chinensis]|uniref:InlB B-repeat-containing protein n=1 Tax=Leucobacter chinensis TaxID=2851010 RepID=UPI001C23E406
MSAASAAPMLSVENIGLDADTGLNGQLQAEALPPLPEARVERPDDSEVVNMPDAALRKAVAAEVTGANASGITYRDIRRLRSLDSKKSGISDLTGLEHAENLALLSIDNNNVSSLAPLSQLPLLRQLTASSNPISDITPLATLPQIDLLQLNFTQVSSLEPLRNNKKLQWLQVAYTDIDSLEPLTNLTTIHTIYFQNTEVSDVTPLANLKRLDTISAPSTQIADISPLAGLERLRICNVNSSHVSDITVLETWPRIAQVGFAEQTIVGEPVLVPEGATTFTKSNITSMFGMPYGEKQVVVGGATPTADGEGGIWQDIDDSTQTLEAKVSKRVGPTSALFSATVSHRVERAVFTNGDPADAYVDEPYEFTFQTTDGFIGAPMGASAEPNSYALVSDLIPGMTFDAAGVLSGTPQTEGAFELEVVATDRHGNTLSHVYDLNVLAAKKTFTVTFDSTGGTPVEPIMVREGEPVAAPAEPTRAGFTFAGWSTVKGEENSYDFSTPVLADLELYAVWNADDVAPNPEDTDDAETETPHELVVTGGQLPWLPLAGGLLAAATGVVLLTRKRA